MTPFGRFGNMFPSKEIEKKPYLLDIDPFCIKGNLYYAGNAQYSCLVIDTGEGLILLDAPPAEHMAGTIVNLWKLGYRLEDVKIILLSHEHTDHYGAAMGLKHYTGAQIFLSRIAAQDMLEHPGAYDSMESDFNPINERVTADVLLDDGDVVELGNTTISCVATPGHSRGTMSHFWTINDDGIDYRVGIFGGGGFFTLSKEKLAEDGLDLRFRDVFIESIDKVWDEHVDIMLGNHPFHADTLRKRAEQVKGDGDAFVDPSEWQRFLRELKDSFAEFCALSSEEAKASFSDSNFEEFSGQYLRKLKELNLAQ